MADLNQLKEALRANGVIFEEIYSNETEIKKLQKLSKTTLVLNNQGELWAIKLRTNTQIDQILRILSNYKQLKYLDVSKSSLEILPSELQKLAGLQTLDLSLNKLTTLPKWFQKLAGLQTLDLSNNKLTTLPKWFQKLTGLQTLNLNSNYLTTLPEGFQKLTGLQTLNLSNTNYLTTLPEWFQKLTGLQDLDLSYNNLTTLPEGFQKLTGLQTLNLSNNNLTTLPEWFQKLTGLQDLDLSYNNLTTLPEGFQKLTGLQTLNLRFTKLTTLPEGFQKLTGLQTLNLSSTKLTTLPEGFQKLTGLQTLYLSNNNKLTTLPEWFQKLTGLQALDLSNNKLTTLPEWFQKLTGLQTLNLNSNNLTTLPKWFQKLTKLQTLYLSDNDLTTLPKWFQKLTGLLYIDISNNSFKTLPLELLPFLQKLNVSTFTVRISDVSDNIIEQGWWAIEQHYIEKRKTLQEPDMDYLAELKVMIIGNGSSGKTCISKALKEKENYKHADHTAEPATEGIELRDIEHVFGHETWKLRMWDLGGQAAYAATQTMFMTDQTLYLVVMDARTEKQPDIYLHYVQTIASASPIIIMINKVDQNKWFGLNKQFYVKNPEYPHIQEDIVRFSCAENREKYEAELFSAIKKVLSNTVYGFRSKQWAPKWLKVRNELMDYLAKNTGYCSITKYYDICTKNDLTKDVGDVVLIGCEKLGMVFAPIAKNPSFKNDWIMHAEWITKGINLLFKLQPADSYKRCEIYEHMNNSKNTSQYSREETNAILDSLEKEELAVEDTTTNKIIIPALLPTDKPEKFPEKETYQMWHLPNDGNLLDSTYSEIRFRYPFLHPKIKQTFMVNLYLNHKNLILYNYGACWHQKGIQVVMMEDTNDLVFYLHDENAKENNSSSYANLCNVQKNIQEIMSELHKKHHIKKWDLLHVFRTGEKGEYFAEYSNKDLHTLLHEMNVREVPLPSIQKTLPVEIILRGSNEAMLKDELQKAMERGNAVHVSAGDNSPVSIVTTTVKGAGNIEVQPTVTINVQTITTQIKELDELNENQKRDLIKLLADIDEATKENNESKKQQCKNRFEKIKETLKEKGPTVLRVLSQIATIAGFVKGCL